MSSWVGSVPFADIGMTEAKLDLLRELAEDSEYWNRAYLFLQSVTNRKLSTLSNHQRSWLTEIIFSLDTELYVRSWRVL